MEPNNLSSVGIPKKIIPKQKKELSAKRALLVGLVSSLLFTILGFSLAIAISKNNQNGSNNLSNSSLNLSSEELKTKTEVISSEGEVYASIAKNVSKSVVLISIYGSDKNNPIGFGSGIIINDKDLILTNKHVVESLTDTYTVTDYKGEEISATVLGRDPVNDLAFVKAVGISNMGVPAEIGDSSNVQIGQKVLAIGNALGLQNTVTAGIISGLGRPLQAQIDYYGQTESLYNLIQTDAAINPGNSGGPLVNLNGEVIGINTAIIDQSQSIGFSIPINDAKSLISDVEAGKPLSRPYLGIRYIQVNDQIADNFNLALDSGIVIYSNTGSPVESGSPADKAGLKEYDVITKIGSTSLGDNNSIQSALTKYKPGDKVIIYINRDGKNLEIEVELGSR
jgi:serine protease Do